MRWFSGAILLLVAALVFKLGLLAYAMYVLLGVMLVSRLLTRSWAENLSATRRCNRLSVAAGNTVAVVVTVENGSPLPVAWALLEDLLPHAALGPPLPKLGIVGQHIQMVTLKGNSRKTLLYQLQCNRRGYFQIGPLVLETGDVFGLHRRWCTLTAPHFLLVYPEVISLAGFDIASRRPVGEVRMTHRLYEDPTRMAGVRRYEPGDPLNRVHWRATARTATLHSKVYEPSSIAGATILLDFHKADYAPRHEPYRSELAVTAAASLANAVYQMGRQIGLVTNGRDAAERIREEGWDPDPRTRQAARLAAGMLAQSDRLQPQVIETRQGAEQLSRILEALARVELTDGLDFAGLVSETASRLPRNATALALLPAVSTETAIALGNLRRKGLAVTAVLNTYDEFDYDKAAARLMAEGIEARHLRDEAAVVTLCQEHVLR